MGKMKIGTTSSSYYINGTTQADYALMAAHGYTTCDYSGIALPCDKADSLYSLYFTNYNEFEKRLLDEKKRAADNGIVFSQVHGTWPVVDTTPEKREKNLELMKACVVATQILCAKNLVVHPVMPYEWGDELDSQFSRELNTEFFTRLCEKAIEHDVDICMENMPTKKHKLAGVRAITEFVKELGLKNLFICLDTGHCNVVDDDCGEMLRVGGKLIKTLHVHDNCRRFDDHLIPFYGNINWSSFKQGLHDIDFDGSVSMECGFNRGLPRELYLAQMENASKIMKFLAE